MHEETPTRLREKPTWLISQVSTVSHRMLAGELAAVGSRAYHFRLLAALAEFGPSSQAVLGRRTAMDRSDVVAAINELAAQGLVSRDSDQADRRRNIVSITPPGAERFKQLDGLLSGVQDELLAPLSAAERSQLTELLTRVLVAQR